MSQEMETILRKSLDDVDRTMKIQWVQLIMLFCILATALTGIAYISVNAVGLRAAMPLIGSAMVVILAMLTFSLVIIMHTTRMTNKILKAIELLSQP